MIGTIVTTPFWSTLTRTLVLTYSPVKIVPSNTILTVVMQGFSFLMISAATVPWTPTSSGHELLPAYKPGQKGNSDLTSINKRLARDGCKHVLSVNHDMNNNSLICYLHIQMPFDLFASTSDIYDLFVLWWLYMHEYAWIYIYRW